MPNEICQGKTCRGCGKPLQVMAIAGNYWHLQCWKKHRADAVTVPHLNQKVKLMNMLRDENYQSNPGSPIWVHHTGKRAKLFLDKIKDRWRVIYL